MVRCLYDIYVWIFRRTVYFPDEFQRTAKFLQITKDPLNENMPADTWEAIAIHISTPAQFIG